MLAVRIVLPRTSTIVFNRGIVGRQSHPHTKLRYQRNIGGCRLVVHVDHNPSISLEMIGQGQIGPHRQCHLDDDLVAFCTNRLEGALLGSILPDSQAFGIMCCMLVVVFWFPEIGFEGCLQHLLTTNYPRGEGT